MLGSKLLFLGMLEVQVACGVSSLDAQSRGRIGLEGSGVEGVWCYLAVLLARGLKLQVINTIDYHNRDLYRNYRYSTKNWFGSYK